MTRTRKIVLLVLLLILFVGVTLGSMFYYKYAESFNDRFLPGTQINGVEVGKMTVPEAEAALAASVGDYSLDVIFPDGSKETVSGEDIGFSYALGDKIGNLMENQNKFKWPLGYINVLKDRFNVKPQFDRAKLSLKIHRMPQTQQDPETIDYTTNAYVGYTDGTFSVVPEHQGNNINPFSMYRVASESVSKADRELYVEQKMDDILVKPTITSDEPGLAINAEKLNDFQFASITYVTSDGTNYVLDGNVMKDWLRQDAKGELYIDPAYWSEKQTEYVAWLAEKVDTVYKDHPFHTTDGRDVILPGTAYYGWEIDQELELEQMKQDIAGNAVVEREPVYKKREGAYLYDNNGFGQTYVEIDLGHQHMYIYKDGQIALETDVVSGTNTPKRRTPAGAFTACDKARDRILRGDVQPDGSWGYESYVAYWIRLTNDGVGLHDASWRGTFGGDIWRYGGSHGCINCPPRLMPQIFELVDEGTPIAVYYD
ncbi:MAG: L,D-transpeptidase family protein [Firmicutes bacterium]|nr:L,D-transpeptidase family protein [Bacillota bacterium]